MPFCFSLSSSDRAVDQRKQTPIPVGTINAYFKIQDVFITCLAPVSIGIPESCNTIESLHFIISMHFLNFLMHFLFLFFSMHFLFLFFFNAFFPYDRAMQASGKC